jgi:ribosomal protein S18 acetylase RimI-like enzyme
MSVALADLKLVSFDPETHNVGTFDCGDSDLNEFLKNDAARYQHDHLSHTRLVFLNGKLVGYITLLADCIILKTSEKKHILERLLDFHQSVYTFPALKIGRLGVQNECKRMGIGTQLLKYAVGLVVRLNKEMSIGCRLITLDAYPDSIAWYQKNGFVFNKHYAKPENTHPSMRYDILKSPQIA